MHTVSIEFDQDKNLTPCDIITFPTPLWPWSLITVIEKPDKNVYRSVAVNFLPKFENLAYTVFEKSLTYAGGHMADITLILTQTNASQYY